jgi:hypothetical protein
MQEKNDTKKDFLNLDQSAHPCVITWDLILKIAPIALYIVASFLPNSLIIRLSCITILAAIDFWFTKNISGRVLVGLRWGRVVHEDGEEEFIYETKRNELKNNPVDSKFFWGLLAVSFVIWLVFLFFNILALTNLMIILIPVSLLGCNLYSFYKCSKVQQDNVKNFVNKQKQKATNEAVNYGINNIRE